MNKSILVYFGRKMPAAAAADAVLNDLAFTLEDFIGCAELEPHWSLEVICDYIDKIDKLYEKFPDDGSDIRCPFYENKGEEDID